MSEETHPSLISLPADASGYDPSSSGERGQDLFILACSQNPPTFARYPRDPHGIHKVIWDQIEEEDFTFPPGNDRLIVSYETGARRAAYIEPVAVGDKLPAMPLFLTNTVFIEVPLEPTYQARWKALPEDLRRAVETGRIPDPEAEE